jgi:hypothetical protein
MIGAMMHTTARRHRIRRRLAFRIKMYGAKVVESKQGDGISAAVVEEKINTGEVAVVPLRASTGKQITSEEGHLLYGFKYNVLTLDGWQIFKEQVSSNEGGQEKGHKKSCRYPLNESSKSSSSLSHKKSCYSFRSTSRNGSVSPARSRRVRSLETAPGVQQNAYRTLTARLPNQKQWKYRVRPRSGRHRLAEWRHSAGDDRDSKIDRAEEARAQEETLAQEALAQGAVGAPDESFDVQQYTADMRGQATFGGDAALGMQIKDALGGFEARMGELLGASQSQSDRITQMGQQFTRLDRLVAELSKRVGMAVDDGSWSVEGAAAAGIDKADRPTGTASEEGVASALAV